MSARLILPLLLLPVLAGCNEIAGSQPASEPRPVVVETVHFAPRTLDRSFVGTIRPRIESDLGFRVGGKVAARLVQVGDSVKNGQPLARLDETDLRLVSEQAAAELRAAKVNLEQAEAQEVRYRELRKKGWTPDATMDRQEALTADARGRLERAQRQMELANNSLEYATLTADADGIVTDTRIEPGQVVASGQPAIRVARLGEKEAVIAVPEILVERVKTNPATVTLWSQPGKKLAAQLRELSPSADPQTRTFQARFAIPQAGADMVLGMTATVTIADNTGERVARLPLSALFNQAHGPSLWVVDAKAGSLKLQPVQIAAYDGHSVLVTEGVSEGDQVVSLGVQKLDAMMRVRIVEPR